MLVEENIVKICWVWTKIDAVSGNSHIEGLKWCQREEYLKLKLKVRQGHLCTTLFEVHPW